MAEDTPAASGLVRLVRALNVLATVTLYLAAFGLVLMTALVAWQVFARYVLDDSPSWTEATSILIMSWFIFLGAAVGVRENFHMGFDVLLYVLPTSAKIWLRSISDLAVLAFGIGMVVYGGQLIVQTWPSPIPVLQLPGGFVYMPVTAGGVLIALFATERLLLRFAGMEVEHDPSLDDATLSEV
ncbi:TRAP transporter small permease [Rubellimicrobium rubrum]|uniref:TRAP transporter small permease protein n=1 Tax=Rubellimicrobium rubrum TaxID=2585369 RepID=A0A5C4MUD2_9RHOB|nr:TRAP transporter small permease [Rubellimicrobium rubrum]TNC47413.1 TRAP transporter small permease [Rubellimicrobium rubrum]